MCIRDRDDVYLDLAGLVQRFLDFLGNAVSQEEQSIVVEGVRRYHDAYLAARLNGEAARYALEPAGDLLQAFQALDIACLLYTSKPIQALHLTGPWRARLPAAISRATAAWC